MKYAEYCDGFLFINKTRTVFVSKSQSPKSAWALSVVSEAVRPGQGVPVEPHPRHSRSLSPCSGYPGRGCKGSLSRLCGSCITLVNTNSPICSAHGGLRYLPARGELEWMGPHELQWLFPRQMDSACVTLARHVNNNNFLKKRALRC